MNGPIRPKYLHKLVSLIVEEGRIFLIDEFLSTGPRPAKDHHARHKLTMIPICDARFEVSNANRDLMSLQGA